MAGLVTTVTASAIYIPLGVHTWLGGEGMPWGISVFLDRVWVYAKERCSAVGLCALHLDSHSLSEAGAWKDLNDAFPE